MTRLTLPRLKAMDNALSAMLAGSPDDGGDWDPENSFASMDAAHSWVLEQIAKREKPHIHDWSVIGICHDCGEVRA